MEERILKKVLLNYFKVLGGVSVVLSTEVYVEPPLQELIGH